MISFDFPTDSYHRLKENVKAVLKTYKLRWSVDKWASDTIIVDAIFMGHNKPATLIIKGATVKFINDLKKSILIPRILLAGGEPINLQPKVPKLHECGEQLYVLKDVEVCPICNFIDLEPEVKVKEYADETPQQIEAKKVEDVSDTNAKVLWLIENIGGSLDKLRLFVSFNWYMMEPSKVESWLNSFVDIGIIKYKDGKYMIW
jgi:hypothetical protein